MSNKINKLIRYLYIVLVFIFLYLPIFVIVFYSFNHAKTGALWTGFTLDWYHSLFNDSDVITAFKNSLSIAIMSTIISSIVGTIGAFILIKSKCTYSSYYR